MTGGSLKYAGRWLERLSNESPRGMIASQRKLVYRIRPIDLLCTDFSSLPPIPIPRSQIPLALNLRDFGTLKNFIQVIPMSHGE